MHKCMRAFMLACCTGQSMRSFAMNILLSYQLFLLFVTLTTCFGTESNDGFCNLDDTEENCLKDESEKVSSFVLNQLQFDMEVGDTHELSLSDGRSLALKLLSKRPLLYEIENFLSADEADHIRAEARARGLKKSSVQGIAGNVGGVQLMDLDHDGGLSIGEMRRTLEVNFDAHFTEIDVRKMYDIMKLDPNGDDIVTQEELQKAMPNSKILADYVRQTTEIDATLRGRNSENMFFFPNTETDGTIKAIIDRVAQTVGLPRSLVDKSDMQIVHYGRGGHYNIHLDSTDGPPEGHPSVPCCTRFDGAKKCRACRWATLLFYLNDVLEGGETAFPIADDPRDDILKIFHDDFRQNLHLHCEPESVKLLVKPVKGKAVLWYNHLPAGENVQPWFGDIDEYSRHGSCPVKRGQKWVANFWIKVTDDKQWDLSENNL